jgi:hypothetical protein
MSATYPLEYRMNVVRQESSDKIIANLVESQSSKPINGMMFHHSDSNHIDGDGFKGPLPMNEVPTSSNSTRTSVFCDGSKNQLQQRKYPLRKGKWSDEEEVYSVLHSRIC